VSLSNHSIWSRGTFVWKNWANLTKRRKLSDGTRLMRFYRLGKWPAGYAFKQLLRHLKRGYPVSRERQ
jgi:hypothetical protein